MARSNKLPFIRYLSEAFEGGSLSKESLVTLKLVILPVRIFVWSIALLSFSSERALADFWSFTDSEGIIHFTNIAPKKTNKPWQRIRGDAQLGRERIPKKEIQERGGCDRCDQVPARDRSPERFSRYDDFIEEAARVFQIPMPLIRAVIKVESDFDPRVVSAFGARGLMQLMPSVVKDMGVTDVHNPRENILGGTRLLRILANRYKGDLRLTIAAYHAGVGSLAKYGNQIPPYFHTRKYLGMILGRYEGYKQDSQGR